MLLSQIAAFALLATTRQSVAVRRVGVLYSALLRGRLRHRARLRAGYLRPAADGRRLRLALTAWSAAGIAGPQLVAFLKDHCGPAASTYTFLSALGFVTLGSVLAFELAEAPVGRPAPSCESPLPAIITE